MSELNDKERELIEAEFQKEYKERASLNMDFPMTEQGHYRIALERGFLSAKAYYTRDERLSEAESKICLLLGTHNIACAPELIKKLQDTLKREQEMFQALAKAYEKESDV
jgi:hypothetical protein